MLHLKNLGINRIRKLSCVLFAQGQVGDTLERIKKGGSCRLLHFSEYFLELFYHPN